MSAAGSGISADRLQEAVLSRLEELGVATRHQVEQAQQEQMRGQERLAVILARLDILRDPDGGRRLTPQLGWPVTRVPELAPATVLPLTPVVCRAHRIVPVAAGADGVTIATDDPLTILAREWLERLVRVKVECLLVRSDQLDALLARLEQGGALPQLPPPPPPLPKTPPLPSTSPAPASFSSGPRPSAPPRASASPPAAAAATASPSSPRGEAAREDEPVIQLVDSILKEAMRLRASDIHIEPSGERLRIRYRIDGVLHDVNTPPKALQGPLTSRIKITAGLNIAEKRLPQDGRIQISSGTMPLDVRVSTLPALHGESIVMRLLDRSQAVKGLGELGFPPEELSRWQELIRRPYGMVLVTGPTGSGKTTTLYATLAALNQPDRKLITVEDPVEYQLPGVNQVHVRTSIGLTFAAGLRAMLRQAPDIIMVGEIRDLETAQIAVQAALTGHLVFSTLHTNDAPSALTRLIDMGIAPFVVASTVQGVLAQRLIRRLCAACAVRRPATAEEMVFIGQSTPREMAQGRGCETCHQSGYAGRIGIYELLVMTEPLQQQVVRKEQAAGLRRRAAEGGMRTLRADGIRKMLEGLTTMAEVLRVTPEGDV